MNGKESNNKNTVGVFNREAGIYTWLCERCHCQANIAHSRKDSRSKHTTHNKECQEYPLMEQPRKPNNKKNKRLGTMMKKVWRRRIQEREQDHIPNAPGDSKASCRKVTESHCKKHQLLEYSWKRKSRQPISPTAQKPGQDDYGVSERMFQRARGRPSPKQYVQLDD